MIRHLRIRINGGRKQDRSGIPEEKQTDETTSAKRPDRLILISLIAPGIVPFGGGLVRLSDLSGGGAITPENARFFESPVPVVLHIISVVLYSFLGTFQFAPGYREAHPRRHRIAGRILVPCGLLAALTGLWMSQFYPPADQDGPLLYSFRLVFGSAMLLSILLGMFAILRQDFKGHRAWMIRGGSTKPVRAPASMPREASPPVSNR